MMPTFMNLKQMQSEKWEASTTFARQIIRKCIRKQEIESKNWSSVEKKGLSLRTLDFVRKKIFPVRRIENGEDNVEQVANVRPE